MSDILNRIDVTKCKNYRKECVYNSCDLGDDIICDGLCHFGAVELLKQLQCKEQALEEIEKELKECVYCESQECACDDFEECLKCTKEHILDIINKTKENNQ